VVDPLTVSELWREYADRLLLIARSIGEPAEDAVQDAFVALTQQSTLPDDPLAWLVRTVRNAVLQSKRSTKRRLDRERAVMPVSNWFADQVVVIDDQLDGELMTRWLAELPAKFCETIVMHLWGELTFRQIADVTEQSAATACRRYQEGIQMLRQRAEKETKASLK
jgi:RNA polymerase sigma-70 factor (ECF subfamily)